jgi:hypothetical protein
MLVVEQKNKEEIVPSAIGLIQDALVVAGKLAGATGLEPAASCVTGRRSNQLNYAPALKNRIPCNCCVCLSVPVDSQNFRKMP